jgi:hypothetical protein
VSAVPHRSATNLLAAGLALVAAATIAACGEKPEPAITTSTTTTTTTPEARYQVVYQRSGGVAGIRERLAVTNDGGATLSLGYQPNASTSHFQLTVSELRELRRDLAGANLKPGNAPRTGCADCFVYEITTSAGTTRFDESAVPRDAKPLIAFLQGLVEDNIPAHAAGGTNGSK